MIITAAEYRSAKAKLTRAVNSGDPIRILTVCRETFAAWDNAHVAYPDDWHRWRIAEQDALYVLNREASYR